MKNYFMLAALLLLPLISCKKDKPEDPKEDPVNNTAPSVPTFIDAPDNGETETATGFTITWSAATDADSDALKYSVYLGTNAASLTSVAEELTVTNYEISGLNLGTTYFLRVAVSDGVNTAVSSETREFTTGSVGSYTDSRDGIEYGIKLIGDQIWMTSNLKFNASGSYSYDDNAANDATYGRLYEWSAVASATPEGWHLPTDDEWKTLETFLGMASGDLSVNDYGTSRGTDQGTQLKEGGSSGLDFPLAGYRGGGTYTAQGNRTYLWVNTTIGSDIFRRRLVTADPSVYRFTNPAGDFAISMRLVKD